MAEAFDLARGLQEAGAPALQHGFFLDRVAKTVEGSRDAFARYAVHEFLSEHWRPAWPQDVAAAFAEAKLDFVGPAALALHFADLVMTAEQRDAIAALPRGLSREFLRDLFVKPTLRQDLFVRGRRPANPAVTVPALALALRRLPEDGRIVLETPGGEAELPPAVIGAALAALERGPHTIAALSALEAADFLRRAADALGRGIGQGAPHVGCLHGCGRRPGQRAHHRIGQAGGPGRTRSPAAPRRTPPSARVGSVG